MSQEPLSLEIREHREILRQYKHIAVVGLSANSTRPSHGVARYLQVVGYDIIPINPRYAGQTIFGKHVYASLTEAKEAGEPIEIVDVFRNAQSTPPVAAEAVKVGARVVWLQLGIRNDEAARITHEAGLHFVQDYCIKVEHATLLSA